jgi:hypothetical protein
MQPFALDLPAPALFNNLINKLLLVINSGVGKRKRLITQGLQKAGEQTKNATASNGLDANCYAPSYLQAVLLLFTRLLGRKFATPLTLSLLSNTLLCCEKNNPTYG